MHQSITDLTTDNPARAVWQMQFGSKEMKMQEKYRRPRNHRRDKASSTNSNLRTS